jgi:hypothetical protein
MCIVPSVNAEVCMAFVFPNGGEGCPGAKTKKLAITLSEISKNRKRSHHVVGNIQK